jgi:preprotein translocase subunit SecA
MSDAVIRRLLPQPVLLPRRTDRRPHWVDQVEAVAMALPARLGARWRHRHLARRRDRVLARAPEFEAMSEDALASRTAEIRERLRTEGLQGAALTEAFAAIRELSARRLGLRHFPCQVLGALILVDGRVVEMDTGEGKTLTSTLAVGAAAMAGLPTHVVTVNDYLAARDAENMMPLYRALGLTVGVIRGGLSPAERRAAYAADITYASNAELAFDYLRDRMALGREAGNLRLKVERLAGGGPARGDVVMRGLHFAVVDEADSVLIDEARTPLIIATETNPEDEQAWAEAALALADWLQEGRDYTVHHDRRTVELSGSGRARLAEAADGMGSPWDSRIRREESLRQALSARHLFRLGDHYILRDDKVQIVDEYTGRVLPDRSWNGGLHQLVEVKEGVAVTGRKSPAVRTSYQKVFRRYRRLAGMSGTVREIADELRAVYRLSVIRVAPNRPSRRRTLGTSYFATLAAKHAAIATRAAEVAADGRPVLIGTRSVAASRMLSEALSDAGVVHTVLNAESEAEEAAIIAEAGAPGRVTVATNMAGRGVDIALAPQALAAGGLHVILSERHDARRIDRQLAGRAGRQGEPGSVEAMLSAEDALLEQARPRAALAGALYRAGQRLAPGRAFDRAQRRAERTHAQARKDLLKMDETTGSMLSFAGDRE